MNCPAELTCSMYADGALSPGEAQRLESHLSACPACRARVSALVAEAGILGDALRREDALAHVPRLRAASRTGALPAAAILVLLAAAAPGLVGLVAGTRLPAALAWINPLDAAIAVDLLAALLVYLVTEGSSMITTTIDTAGACVLLALLAWGVFAALRFRVPPAALASIAVAALAVPSLGQALEIRRSEDFVSVPAGETIDDTLVAFGESIEIDGTVTGDVVAFGRRVIVRGEIQGALLTGAETVRVTGSVGDSVVGFARTIEIDRAVVGRNLFGFASELWTRGETTVEGNAVVFAGTANLLGAVGRDLLGFAGEVEVGSEVGGDLTAYTESLVLLAPARIGGDVAAHVPSEGAVRVSPAATVAGTVRTEIEEPDEAREYVAGSFWMWQAVRFAAAFITGLILFWLVPALREATLGSAGDAARAAGIGLLTLAAVPVVAFLTAVTIIGLPIAVLGLLLWGGAIYFAKILLAHLVGRRIFAAGGRRPHFAVSLLLGLVIVLAVTLLPFVGWFVNLLLTLTGLGLLIEFVWRHLHGPADGAEAA